MHLAKLTVRWPTIARRGVLRGMDPHEIAFAFLLPGS